MALVTLTSANSPKNLTTKDFSAFVTIPNCLVLASGGSTLIVNLPTIKSLGGNGRLVVLLKDSITTVTVNCNSLDTISASGGTTLQVQVTGNKQFLILEASILNNLNSSNVWMDVSGGSGGGGGIPIYTSVSYSDLGDLINDGNLNTGTFYLINDFQTKAIIQFSGDLPSGVGNEQVQVGALEPLLVQAISNNTLSATAQSPLYPQDKILYRYSPLQSDYDYLVPNSLGVIYYRQDQDVMVSREYDWRNIKFRRWETVMGNEDFTSCTPVLDADFVDYAPFENCQTLYSVSISNNPTLANDYDQPYILDNTVIKGYDSVFGSNFSAYCNTFLSTENKSIFGSNQIGVIYFSTIKVVYFYANIGSSWGEVNIKNASAIFNSLNYFYAIKIENGQRFDNNNINNLYNLTMLTINSNFVDNSGNYWDTLQSSFVESNNIANLSSCSIYEIKNNNLTRMYECANSSTDSKISFNTSNEIFSNTCLRIESNIVHTISNCNETIDSDQEIRSNSGLYIISCTCRVEGNVVDSITNNVCLEVSGNIADSIVNNSNDGIISGNIATEISSNANEGQISNNTFGSSISSVSGVGNVQNCNGNQVSSVVLGGSLANCNNVDLLNVTTTDAIINNMFNGTIQNKTITPTASMKLGTASIVVYDNGLTEFVEQVLTSGVVTYSSAVTS